MTEKFMETLRIYGIQSAADTTTCHMVSTPNSKTEKLAMLIHQIRCVWDTHTVVSHEQSISIVDRDTGTDDKYLGQHPEVVDQFKYHKKQTTSGSAYLNGVDVHKFDPPKLYSKSEIGMSVYSNSTGAAVEGRIAIDYTLEKVSKDAYIDALVEG